MGSCLVFGSLLALWDLARHQAELRWGTYILPFGYALPWWMAGDLFVTLGILEMILIIIWGIYEV